METVVEYASADHTLKHYTVGCLPSEIRSSLRRRASQSISSRIRALALGLPHMNLPSHSVGTLGAGVLGVMGLVGLRVLRARVRITLARRIQTASGIDTATGELLHFSPPEATSAAALAAVAGDLARLAELRMLLSAAERHGQHATDLGGQRGADGGGRVSA